MTSRAVEKPGARIREKSSDSESWADAVDQPLLDGARAHGFDVQTAPVIAYSDQYLGAGVQGGEANGRGGGFAGRAALLGGLDAVIHAVADQMNQRIVELIDDRLVQFGVGSFDDQIDLFMQFDAEIVNQPAESFEGVAERQHPDTHRVLPQLRRQPVDFLGNGQDVRIVPAGGDLAQAGLHGHQFAHQVDELIQLFGRHANARRDCRPLGCRRCSWQSRLAVAAAGAAARSRIAGSRLNLELAVIFDEDEDVPDRVPPRGGLQSHVPGDVAPLRIDLAERGNCGGVELDPELSQFPHFAQQEQRVGPIQRSRPDRAGSGCATR